MAGKAIVCGGSIGGLFAAAALLKKGWEIELYERTAVELAGRGAGIVTHGELINVMKSVGASMTDLGVDVEERVAFDLAGEQIKSIPYAQTVTSWDRIHQLLRKLIPNEHHHLGKSVQGYKQDKGTVEVLFEDGGSAVADILVGADGFRSAIRAQMLPDIKPQYSGYVVWRALANEADLGPRLRDWIFDKFGMFMPTGTQIVGYPIAGPGNDLRPGFRRYNFVWYAPVEDKLLNEMLTDADGIRHEISIPPPLVRAEVLEVMQKQAEQSLPKPFIELLAHSERPFFTPIYDHHSPKMVDGRVVLSGDAACVARPHVGMGVTKAASDAFTLANMLDNHPLEDALKLYSDNRVPVAKAAYDRSQMLGRHIFAKPASGANLDGRSNPNIDEIMNKTAIADFN